MTAFFSSSKPTYHDEGIAALLRLLSVILSWALRLPVLYSPQQTEGQGQRKMKKVEQEKAENFPHHHSGLWKSVFRQASRKRKHYEDSAGSPGICGTVTSGSCKPADSGRPSGSLPCTLMLLKHSGAEISFDQRFIIVPLARPTWLPLFTPF